MATLIYGPMASEIARTTIYYEAVTKQVCRRCGHVKED